MNDFNALISFEICRFISYIHTGTYVMYICSLFLNLQIYKRFYFRIHSNENEAFSSPFWKSN